jgi:hypothetical protein
MVARPSSVRYPVADSRSDSSAGYLTEYTQFRMSDQKPILQPGAGNRVLPQPAEGARHTPVRTCGQDGAHLGSTGPLRAGSSS